MVSRYISGFKVQSQQQPDMDSQSIADMMIFLFALRECNFINAHLKNDTCKICLNDFMSQNDIKLSLKCRQYCGASGAH